MNYIIYSDLLVTMGLTYSSASSSDFYSECWQCVEVIAGDYRAIISWMNPETTSSIASDLDLSIYVNDETDASVIASNIWENIGDCISGVWIFN